jgi:hypothetical protein
VRKLKHLLLAGGLTVGATTLGVQGTAEAATQVSCGDEAFVYNRSGDPSNGPQGTVELNGWDADCQNALTTLAPHQDAYHITNPYFGKFDPEFIGTTFCWQVTLKTYINGILQDGTYTFNWSSPGVVHSDGWAWAALGGYEYEYDIVAVTKTNFAGCKY